MSTHSAIGILKIVLRLLRCMMNKRIEELAKQCQEYYEVEGEMAEIEFDYEKFAELILAEVQKVYDDNRFDDDYEIYAFLNVVKEHFGVE